LEKRTTVKQDDPDMANSNPDRAAEAVLREIGFGKDGLVPAVAQQHDTGEVLMVAWMNHDAIIETLKAGQAVYWSRSRKRLWRKGESSGQIQTLKELRIDCDGDTILLLVDQKGVACHTGRHNCFFRALKGDKLVTIADVEVDPAKLYGN
jgi:phosphoribosyl-AMP cyclohydrolase